MAHGGRRPGPGARTRAATRLPIPALTEKDIADLTTVVEVADLVEISFVQDPSDVLRLHHALLTAMRRPGVGVMIARGDLAVEVGYERLAELQEEILWLCEAAHLPVIWATQVLDHHYKKNALVPQLHSWHSNQSAHAGGYACALGSQNE